MKASTLMAIHAKEKPEYLDAALRSLATQTLKADELILVEDGPISPGLRTLINRYRAELNIVSVRIDVNAGLGNALHQGLNNCKNEIVFRMDGDDICFPARFETQLSFLEQHPEIDILGAAVFEIDTDGQIGKTRVMPENHQDIARNIWACPLIHPSLAFRKSRIMSVGSYDPELRRRQDYDLWFRSLKGGLRFHNLQQPLLYYRFSIETHKRQNMKAGWQQAMIGWRGSRSLDLSPWKRFAVFFPFIRSFLPAPLAHKLYLAFQKLDPRRKS